MLVVRQKSKAGHDPGRGTRNVKMQSKFRGVLVALETIQGGLFQGSMKRDSVTSMAMSCTAPAEPGLSFTLFFGQKQKRFPAGCVEVKEIGNYVYKPYLD